MKSSYLKNKIGGAVLAFSILLGIGMAASMTAQAQGGYYGRDDRNQQDRDYRDRDQRRRDRDRDRDDRYGRRRGRDNDGYGNYGGSYELRQTALNAGFAEGVKEGRKDRQHGDRYDYQDEGAYQKATKDYNSRLGDRELYRRYFREGFEHGYADGYNGY
jgi:hypothetical protein